MLDAFLFVDSTGWKLEALPIDLCTPRFRVDEICTPIGRNDKAACAERRVALHGEALALDPQSRCGVKRFHPLSPCRSAGAMAASRDFAMTYEPNPMLV